MKNEGREVEKLLMNNNRDDAEQIAAKIYNYEIDENGFRQVTRSLHPYVAAVYGWKTLQDNLVQVK